MARIAAELETALPTEPSAAERRMENPFSGPLASASDYVLAAVYNEPFDQGIPAPTVNWNAGAEDRLVIYPRYPGSTVSARRGQARTQSGSCPCCRRARQPLHFSARFPTC